MPSCVHKIVRIAFAGCDAVPLSHKPLYTCQLLYTPKRRNNVAHLSCCCLDGVFLVPSWCPTHSLFPTLTCGFFVISVVSRPPPSPALRLPPSNCHEQLPPTIVMNQFSTTNCQQPVVNNQLSSTDRHQPIVTNQLSTTNCHQPIVTYQLSSTNCHQPIVINQLSTNCHQPVTSCRRQIVTHQLPPTNCYPPIVTNQLSPTKCHQPIVTNQLSTS